MNEPGRKRRKLALLVLAVPLLASCSGSSRTDEGKANIGWHCEGEPGTESWKCVQRPMRNGHPVGEPIGGLEESSVAEQPSALESNPAPAVVRKRKQTSWRDQLPALKKKTDPEEIVERESVEAKPLVPIETRPELPPEPEAAFQTWADEKPKQTTDSVEGSVKTAVIAEPKLKIETPSASPELVASPELATTMDTVAPRYLPTTQSGLSPSGYTVQLGAFSSEAQALEFIQTSNLQKLEMNVDSKEQSGQPLFVVTHGQFVTREAAQSDWDSLEGAQELDVWIRPAR